MTDNILVDHDLCSGCRTCIEVCPRDCFSLSEDKKSVFTPAYCHNCCHCISTCPENAISHRDYPSSNFLPIKDFLDPKFLDGEQMYYLLKSIRSTRKYLKKPIEQEKINKLVDIVRYSPTGHHSQNVEVLVVTDPVLFQQLKDESERTIKSFYKKIANPLLVFFAKIFGKGAAIKKLRETKPRFDRMLKGFETGEENLFHGAPLMMIFHANKNSITPLDNCTIAATNVRLLSHTFGLGSCFIGYVAQFGKYNTRFLEILKIPKNNKIYQTLVIGYPKHKFRTFIARKELQVVFY